MASGSESGRNSASKPPGPSNGHLENHDHEDADESTSKQKKRKKAARACNHCQTAHLTCDDNRPCGRCVKRGLGETCQDGARKKAKYLRDIEDALVNAGKAVPTHFIHSPPSTENGAGNANEDTTSTSNRPASQRNGSNNSNQQSASDDALARQSSDISPSLHSNIGLPSTTSHHQQHARHPTESPAQFTNVSLPTPTLQTSNLHPSPSVDVPPSDDTVNNSNSNHSTQLPPNAYSNTPSNLLSFDTPTAGTSNQLQPFNFFNDLNNGLVGLGGTTGDFGIGMTSNNSANLEYAVLSSMLQNSGYGNMSPMGFTDTLSGNGNNGNSGSGRSHNPMFQGIFTGSEDYGNMSFGFPPAAFENSNNTSSGNGQHSNTNLIMISQGNTSPAGIDSFLPTTNNNNNNQNQALPALQAPTNSFGALPIDHNWPTIASKLPNGSENINNGQHHQQHQQHQQQQHPSHQVGSGQAQQSPSFATNLQMAPQAPKPKPTVSSTGVMKVEDVYKYINKPYNYLEAYHALIRYLQAHFENKSSVLRIIRSLAIYRPSIIALHMPLTVEDEIFVERSFQRTLIELEKLISFSGTPTLVWRRTGEIVLVGTEFTLLSEWRREDLLSRDRFTTVEGVNAAEDIIKEKKASRGKKRYIFEIFDQDSLVEYYESFAQHAFESSSATIMFTCSIVTPKGRKVPCTFGYNLKRDIFGLPQMIIGQFLPILTSADDPTT